MTVPQRIENWPSLMDRFIRDNSGRSFEWGAWDCCLAAIAHVDAITGSGLYAAHAGLYHDEQSAADYLDVLGGVEGAANSTFGASMPHVRKAQRGDVVMIDSGQGMALGFIDLTGTKIATLACGIAGFKMFRIDRALKAWRI